MTVLMHLLILPLVGVAHACADAASGGEHLHVAA